MGSPGVLLLDLRSDVPSVVERASLRTLRALAAVAVVGGFVAGGIGAYLSFANPLAIPAGYANLSITELENGAREGEVAYELTIREATIANFYFVIQEVSRGSVAITMKGAEGIGYPLHLTRDNTRRPAGLLPARRLYRVKQHLVVIVHPTGAMNEEEVAVSGAILVAYASRAGSTREVAQVIGETIAQTGESVDVRPFGEVTDLSPYSAVVAGSAIQGGKWLPEAIEFVAAHQAELRSKPFASFLVCITLGGSGEKYRDGVAKWMAPVRALVRPVCEGLFAGRLDFQTAPGGLKTLLLRATVAMGALPQGDHRDWDAIRVWARDLSLRLSAT